MKYTLVTGASKGIGRALVEQLLKKNGSEERGVIGVARDQSSLEQIFKDFNKDHQNKQCVFDYVQGSVTEKQTVLRVFEKCKDLEVDSIIFNAGI